MTNSERNPNMSQAETQKDLIKEALLLGEKLTVLDGVTRFKCLCLSQRISDLKLKEGLDIKKEMILTESGKRVAQYSLYREFRA